MKISTLLLVFVVDHVLSAEDRPSSNRRSLPPPYIIHNSINNSMNKVGITNKIAELVTSSFAEPPSKIYYPKDGVILVKDDDDGSPPGAPSNHLMSGMLKMLGFDSRKLGAIAVNGFVFMAKMVRYSAYRVMDFISEQTLDWYKIMNYVSQKMKANAKTYPGNYRSFRNNYFIE